MEKPVVLESKRDGPKKPHAAAKKEKELPKENVVDVLQERGGDLGKKK